MQSLHSCGARGTRHLRRYLPTIPRYHTYPHTYHYTWYVRARTPAQDNRTEHNITEQNRTYYKILLSELRPDVPLYRRSRGASWSNIPEMNGRIHNFSLSSRIGLNIAGRGRL